MELDQALQGRRSCRAFKDDPVTEEQINQLIAAFTLAPSPLNLQPWQFVVTTDPQVKAQVRAVARDARQAVMDQGGPGWVAKYSFEFLEQAPALLSILCDPAKGGLGDYFNQPHGSLMAASAGVQNLMLTAAEQGLGTLWFTFFDPNQMRPVLNVPENLELAAIIPLGVPADSPKSPPRKPAVIHQQRYQQKA
jgi:nitroreductase